MLGPITNEFCENSLEATKKINHLKKSNTFQTPQQGFGFFSLNCGAHRIHSLTGHVSSFNQRQVFQKYVIEQMLLIELIAGCF